MSGGNGRAPAGEMMQPDWIAVDWGTTRLRAAAMAGDRVLHEAESAEGMGTLTPAGFEPALLRLIGDWTPGPLDVVACGMIGARNGWAEVPYRPVPCTPLGPLVRLSARDPRLSVRVVPGLSQSSPPDVMRGEETQIAGFLGQEPGFDGILCLPGTHSKWVRISAGEVVGFQTFLTGEMFDLLATRSVLRHTVGSDWDAEAFTTALSDALARPEALAARLFSLRAGALLGHGSDGARSRLSGLLIGAELAAARPWWLGQDVVVIGAADPARIYAQALTAQGAAPRSADGTAVARAGLGLARRGGR
jgi:2-dehydro-3-deoxygalactonokinase